MGEANRQSSETWHDNAPLDVAQRKFERLSEQHQQLASIIRQAVLVPSSGVPDVVGPDSTVVVEASYRKRHQTRQNRSRTTSSVKRRTLHFADSLLPDTQDEGYVSRYLTGSWRRRLGANQNLC